MEDGSPQAPYQIICEGNADRVFLARLLKARWGETSEFAVRCTHVKTDSRCAGKSGLTETLFALNAARAVYPAASRGIAIVFDSDEDPAAAFTEIVESIRSARGLSYPLPDNPLQIKPGPPSIAVALIPWHDRQGHLDELIYEALSKTHADLIGPVGDFEKATIHRTKEWPFGPKSKMRLRCMIAASHRPDPSTSLAFYLESSKCPVDYGNPCFDRLMTFFDDFREKA